MEIGRPLESQDPPQRRFLLSGRERARNHSAPGRGAPIASGATIAATLARRPDCASNLPGGERSYGKSSDASRNQKSRHDRNNAGRLAQDIRILLEEIEELKIEPADEFDYREVLVSLELNNPRIAELRRLGINASRKSGVGLFHPA
jgi:hypothetical protein